MHVGPDEILGWSSTSASGRRADTDGVEEAIVRVEDAIRVQVPIAEKIFSSRRALGGPRA